VVELASYTDTRDTEERNDILSQKRAQSVVDYLISRGIDPDRLVAKGYGERVPRVLNKDITREGYTFKAGTVITDSLINTLSSTAIKEAAHQLNRRTEFSILRNDFVPKTKVAKIPPTKIEVVVNPEENNLSCTISKDGYLEGDCYLNGITLSFEYDPKEKEFFISPVEAVKLLKNGVIDKNDFQGDPSKVIGEGTIADKAVFTVKELRVGKNTIRDIPVVVNKKISSIRFGENTLKKFGEFVIDSQRNLIQFK